MVEEEREGLDDPRLQHELPDLAEGTTGVRTGRRGRPLGPQELRDRSRSRKSANRSWKGLSGRQHDGRISRGEQEGAGGGACSVPSGADGLAGCSNHSSPTQSPGEGVRSCRRPARPPPRPRRCRTSAGG